MNRAQQPASSADPAVEFMPAHEQIKAITIAIKDADRDMRRRFRWLRHQDAIGSMFFALVVITMVSSSFLFVLGYAPFWICIAINAICLSIVREIEHDLIHNLYFKQQPFLQNVMMAAVWPFLGNLPHPWFRRKMHLLHHRTSGHEEDFEERLIGNGMKFGPLKILTMIDPPLAMFFRRRELKEIPFYDPRKVALACVPVVYVYYAILFSFLLFHLVSFGAWTMGVTLSVPGWVNIAMPIVNAMMIVYVAPNMLRQICLQIVSSNMHYYGDIENRLEETQVMNAWWMLPLNLFCCNFGATHSIHHFVVNQPFYLRQMVAGKAHAAFRKYGIRYNDAGTILRGNRYSEPGDRTAMGVEIRAACADHSPAP